MGKTRLLYLGLDPARFQAEGAELFHYPVIRTEPLTTWPLHARDFWRTATHLLLTSRSGARYFRRLCPTGWEGKEVFAVGPATADGEGARLAPVPTQEGMVELIQSAPTGSRFFWPCAETVRGELERALAAKGDLYCICPIYRTVCQRLDPVPDLERFDGIVFTSPSTVKGFCAIWGRLPPDKLWIPIGPVTKAALQKEATKPFY
jgi:uroporphyrinogen-III synthase